MKRADIILLVDILSFACFVLLSSTGILLHYLLPPGSGGRVAIWGMTRHEWADIHFLVAVVFFCVLIVHLALHRRLILNMIRGPDPREARLRLALGLTGLIALLLLAFAPLAGPKQPGHSGGGMHQKHRITDRDR